MIEFETILPMPPTINSMFPGNGKRRWRSLEYKGWVIRAAQELSRQHTQIIPMTGRLEVVYRFAFKDKRRNDLANREKALSDFLVDQGVIEDDSLIDDMRLVRMPRMRDAQVYVTVRGIQ